MSCECPWLAIGVALSFTGLACFRTALNEQASGSGGGIVGFGAMAGETRNHLGGGGDVAGTGGRGATSSTGGTSGSAGAAGTTELQGIFAATTSMTSARVGHTATLLDSGAVLIAGGDKAGSAEFYDSAAGTFAAASSMTLERLFHHATLLTNGTVLITGGIGGGNDSTDAGVSAELYAPAVRTFAVPGSMAAARLFNTATLLPSGRVLVAGGGFIWSSLTSAELYDQGTKTFTATGSMNSARASLTATSLGNGKVLIAGGYDGAHALASAELYDPASGIFTPTGSMTVARESHTATMLGNGMVLIAGGVNESGKDSEYLKSAELYAPAAGTFAARHSMAVARSDHTATLLPNGKVLVAGGCDSSNVFASAELFE